MQMGVVPERSRRMGLRDLDLVTETLSGLDVQQGVVLVALRRHVQSVGVQVRAVEIAVHGVHRRHPGVGHRRGKRIAERDAQGCPPAGRARCRL